ncbi:uncharacterized protein Pyn_16683 [Prunus yedoensis var. nudiflora]|uniref:Uncharacterized protein n=1 Tax=Prunus yedoensis var. nudiflora TaxID=2094558 RepID=A0A314YXG6_PRUYE|nr:uncharacterized protein Pyn_16683 [Prunus yedoensis var. nudiflora]
MAWQGLLPCGSSVVHMLKRHVSVLVQRDKVQAEGLVNEIHLKETELERLNGLWRKLESSNMEMNTATNRFGRSTSFKGSASSDYILDAHHHRYADGQTESQQRLTLLSFFSSRWLVPCLQHIQQDLIPHINGTWQAPVNTVGKSHIPMR